MTKLKIPHVFIFLFWIIIVCSILSYFIPSGNFERTKRQYGKMTQTVVVPGSYKEIPKHFSIKTVILGEKVTNKATPISILGVLAAIPKGLTNSATLIFYVFIIGAVFTLIQATGAVNALLFKLIGKFNEKPKLLFFILYMIIFSGSSFVGMSVETVPLVPIFLFVSKRMGYDRVFGFALLCTPLFLGWSTGVTNPFTVQIAQIIAELPIGSGIGLRLLLFVVCALTGFYFLMRYGNRVKNNPSSSLMKDDVFNLDSYGKFEEIKLEKKHIVILLFFVLAYMGILYAVNTIGWGLIQMSAAFMGIAIVVMFISGMGGEKSMEAIIKGLTIMIVPALVVGVARGISVVLQEGLIIDTILNSASTFLVTLPKVVAAQGMLLFQSLLNFFIPSASGQALVSMPLMTPMADILGISRQTAVLAFILGDGLSNMIIPTNGVLMAMLGIAKISFEKWLKFVIPLFIASIIIAMLFISLAIAIGY